MTLIIVATSALTALLFHLPFFSSLATVWRVLCGAVLSFSVLLYEVVLCVCVVVSCVWS